MNGLFKATKKEPVGASMFKFSFKLGGDEDLEESEPTRKKNKNKKKKKKTLPIADVDLKQNELPSESIEVANSINNDGELDKITDLLDDIEISREVTKVVEPVVDQDKPLSKSQKKNLQKKKAKQSAEQRITLNDSPIQSSNNVNSSSTKSPGVQLKGTLPHKAATKESNATKAASVLDSDDEFAVPEPKAPKNNKPKTLPKKNASKASHSEPRATGLAFANLASPEQRGPHFISSKDPELDEATKLRFKYGMGRNLVAIGPAKVRDPNWLPPPPGLTRSVPLSGVFGASSTSKSISPVKKTSVKAVVAAEAPSQEVHSSPFSFSFNGL